MTLIKVAFLSHDWKEQMDIGQLNKLSRIINEPVQLMELPTHSDEYGYIVHNSALDLQVAMTDKERDAFWCNLTGIRYGDFEDEEEEAELTASYQDGVFSFPTIEDFRRLLVK